MRDFLLHVTRLRMYRLELLCVHVCIFFAFVVRGCDMLTRLAARQESNNNIYVYFKKKEEEACNHRRAHSWVHVECRKVCVLTVHVADLAVLDCWKDTWKVCSPG